MGSVKLKDLKAYVRYDGSGRVVAGSLVFRKKKPKNGRWVEITKNECCDLSPNSSTTTTTTQGGGGTTPTAWIGYSSGSSLSACQQVEGTSVVLYTSVSTLIPGTFLYTDAALTQLYSFSLGFVPVAINGVVWQISEVNGSIINPQSCSSITTTSTTTTLVPGSCPTLGRAANFSVLGASTVTNTGFSYVFSDLGLYPGTSVTGFPPGQVLGTQHITDVDAQNAQTDALTAFNALNALPSTLLLPADIGGMTITPNVGLVGSSLAITGTVTLDAQNDPNAVFIFRIPTTFITATNAVVNLINQANAGNVYWVVGSSATLGTNSNISGNIIAQASVTFNTGAGLGGRAIALTGAVTLDNAAANGPVATCTVNPIG
jgi:hypothetical protein